MLVQRFPNVDSRRLYRRGRRGRGGTGRIYLSVSLPAYPASASWAGRGYLNSPYDLPKGQVRPTTYDLLVLCCILGLAAIESREPQESWGWADSSRRLVSAKARAEAGSPQALWLAVSLAERAPGRGTKTEK